MSNVPSPPQSPSDGLKSVSIFSFFKETGSKLFQSLVNKSSFGLPHTPSSKSAEGKGSSTLSYPFQPVSVTKSEVQGFGEVPKEGQDLDLEVIDNKISNLEEEIRIILTDDGIGFSQTVTKKPIEQDVKPVTPPRSSCPSVDALSSTIDELDKLLPPTDKIPTSIYQELLEILETQTLNCRDNRSCQTPGVRLEDDRAKCPSSSNKERNMRYEVLKWYKN